MEGYRFFVPGKPQPAGSRRGFVKAGRAIMAPANPNQKSWQLAVSECGYKEMGGQALRHGPVWMDVEFVFLRPKSHYRKNGDLREDAPTYVKSKPDLDKLLRAIGDALTGVFWHDDSQIVELTASKVYGDRQGSEIRIWWKD